MNPPRHLGKQSAFTLIEILVILLVFAVMFAILMPALNNAKAKSRRISCISNHKHIGLAMRMWSHDHEERFPWQVSTNKSGTMEFLAGIEVAPHFVALSNELTVPKVLACGSDRQRVKIGDWTILSATNISYFLGLDASASLPQTLLAGDRHVSTNGRIMTGLLTLRANAQPAFTPDLHDGAGNLGLGDGSAMQVTTKTLRLQLQTAFAAAYTNGATRLLLP